MTLPIQYALSYPDRKNCYVKRLNLAEISKLEFFNPDFKKFKCLQIAYRCAKIGGTMTAVMSAANEIAVKNFLNKKIKFDEIPMIVEKVIGQHKSIKSNNISKYVQADAWARIKAQDFINNLIEGRK
jgi:1-deoxy-D-xylulose-5-phosphate reductoisomerase